MKELDIPKLTPYPGISASASEDFANIAEQVPSAFMYLSAGYMDDRGKYSAHNPKVQFNEDVCPIGAACLAALCDPLFKLIWDLIQKGTTTRTCIKVESRSCSGSVGGKY